MKLSKLTELVREITGMQDPEIKVVTSAGFSDITEVLSRKDYYNETYSGKLIEKGEFACIETGL